MEFRILGPLEVVADGHALDLGGAKQRALLTMLLLEANRTVSRDRLIDALWEDEPTATAAKALQVYVSHIRKLLGKERLVTQPAGYLLRADPEELDVGRVLRLRAERRLGDALALWRGPPLAEFAQKRFAQIEIGRLEELRLACLEERIEADLANGRSAELVGELDALVAEHPLRERLRAQLMLALYRCGRQGEALEAYQAARRALVEELGVEPGRPLRELQQAILNQDPLLDLSAAPDVEEAGGALTLLHESEPMAQDVRKTVTAVSVALVVSSAEGTALDPEALRRVTGRAFVEFEGAVARHGGIVEAVSGDGITAVFGLPSVHEDDALRGVRAAAETRSALTRFAGELVKESPLQLEFRIGISTGEVVAGAGFGSTLRATGEPLTLSSRLGQAAEPGEILFTDRTRRLVREAVTAEATGDAWRLITVVDGTPTAGDRLNSPMVGRDRERRRLRDAFDQAVADSSCQLFTVLGPAGVGKSRLVQEFLRDVAGRALVAGGRCLPYGEGITFWPLLGAVKTAVGLDDLASPEQSRAQIARTLSDEQDADLVAQHVAEIIGLTEVSGITEHGFASVRALFEALARTRPLLLVFDDIHWAEPTFLDLLDYIADTSRGAPILLICLARPELLDVRRDWGGGKLNATSVLLEPLSTKECFRMIEHLAALGERARRRVAEAVEGNPLFVEEMLAALIDDGVLVRASGRWVATGDLASMPTPPTIQALLSARLDRLSAGERGVIERASVEGKVFHEGSVRELAADSLKPSVGKHLETLVRKELIRPTQPDFAGEPAFHFRHLLIRDAAYESLPKATRADLHERFARWLERKGADRMPEYEEIVGYHLEQAYRYRTEFGGHDDANRSVAREAATRLGSAGRRAFVRKDATAAVNLISRAAALLPADDPSLVELVPNVRVVQGLSGDLNWADQMLTDAVAAAAIKADRRLEAHALVQRALLRLFTGADIAPDEIFDVADHALTVFEELGDELGIARAWRLVAQSHYLARQGGPSVAASRRALEHARLADDRLEQREIVEWLCVAMMLGPTPAVEAGAHCEELLVDARRDPVLEPIVLAVLSNTEAMQGREERARQLHARWREAVNDLGESIWLSAINFGFVVLVDDPVSAERDFRPGYETLGRIGEQSHFSSVAGHLARAMCAQGKYEEADRLSRESEETARPNDIHSHILWRSARANVLLHRGELAAAEALAREAIAFASESDFIDAHGDALVDLAHVLIAGARIEEAVTAIERSIQLYEQKGNLVSATRARTHLRELARAV
jgi:DNA-binding SARP family transcriptional activator